MPIETEPPAADELEVTLLGRGTGESCVVHVSDGRWIIVDSFGTTRQAARTYLDRLRVHRDAVEIIVITHVHTDHYRGVDRLVDHYRAARLMVTEPLRSDTLLRLYADDSAEPILGAMPVAARVAERRRLPGHPSTPALASLKFGSPLIDEATIALRAMSPVEGAQNDALKHLADIIQGADPIAIRTALKDQNLWSVVLHLSVAGFSVLLTADMVNHPEYGWAAILDEPRIGFAARSPASLVKVPHHGSDGAHHPPMWERLVAPHPVLLIAPFWPSRIPNDADVERLTSLGTVLQAAPSARWTTDEFGNQVSLPAETGIVQARRGPGDASWRVSTELPAFRAGPSR